MSGVLSDDAAVTSIAIKPLVLKVGGAAIDDAPAMTGLFDAVAELHRAAAGGVVLVHGGGAAVDRHLDRLDLVTQRRNGIRITPPDHIDEVVAVLAGTVNTRLVGCLQRSGIPAVGLCLGDGFLARTVEAQGYGFDPGRVGTIAGGDPHLVQMLLAWGYMPVVCSIGLDADGRPLNVNADDAAAGVAALVDARGIVFLTDVPGVLDACGATIPTLEAGTIEARIASGEITGGMIPKVRSAEQAAASTSIPVTIASWHDHAGLAQLAGGDAAGTRVVPAGTNGSSMQPNSGRARS